MIPPWSPLGKWRPKSTARRRRDAAAPFIPRLESLEDRCLPSVVPTIVFTGGTVGQPLANQPSITTSSSQPTTSDTYADIKISVGYVGPNISYVSYDPAGNGSLIATALLSSNGQFTLADGSANSANILLWQGSIAKNQVAQVFNIDLVLTPDPISLTHPISTFAVAIQSSNSATGATFGFTVAPLDMRGNTTGGAFGMIQLSSTDLTSSAVDNPAGGRNGPSGTGNSWSFTNLNGPSTFSITLTNLSFSGSAASSATGNSLGGDAVTRATVVDGYVDLNALGDGNNFSKYLHSLISAGDPAGQTSPDRRSILGPQSLVLADSTPGFYLTLSITEEISHRSSSPAAQATWTGLRPPLEAPLASPQTPNTKVGLSTGKEDTNSNHTAVPDLHGPSQTNFGPMEIMVANILRSWEQAKADDRPKDIAQAAVQEPADEDFESPQVEGTSNLALEWEMRGEPDPLGDLDGSLNQLLDRIVLHDAPSLLPEDESSGPEGQRSLDRDMTAMTMKATSGWGWRVLEECVAPLFLVMCWPWVIGSGSGSLWWQESSRRSRIGNRESDDTGTA